MSRTVFYFALIAFFSSLSVFLVIYVDSSMAEFLAGKSSILPLFAIGSVMSICLFLATPKLLSIMGNSFLFFVLSVIQGASLFLLAASLGSLISTAALVVHMATLGTLGFTLDLFLEKAMTAEGSTGKVRGLFLTAGNIALVISPFIAGSILDANTLSFMYGITLVVFTIFFAISLPMLERFKDPVYTAISFTGVTKVLKGTLGPVIACQFILRMFFSWMAVLLPLYLHESLGFSWTQIGTILTVSLVPFMLFESPIGFLMDTFPIVRPTVMLGFLIFGGAMALLANLPAPVASTVIMFLFISRVGAAMIEIGTETHFFKQVSTENEDAIMLFRITQPFGYLVGAAVASILLLCMDLQSAFILFGIPMIMGCAMALYIKPLTKPDAISPFCRRSNLRC